MDMKFKFVLKNGVGICGIKSVFKEIPVILYFSVLCSVVSESKSEIEIV